MTDEPKNIKELKDYLDIIINRKTEKERKEPSFISISLDNLQKIIDMTICINELKKVGINTDNYNKKVKQYFNHKEKSIETYGLYIEEEYPFSNPKELFLEIENILIDEGLNVEQRNIFYNELSIRKRIPKREVNIIESFIKSLEPYNYSISDEEIEKQNEIWNSLTTKEQLNIIGISDEEFNEIQQNKDLSIKYLEEKTKRINKLRLLKYPSY